MPFSTLPAFVGDATRQRPAIMVGTARVTILLTAEDTGNAFSLFEILVPPHDPGPPMHTHTREDETFYVLQGQQTVILDGQTLTGGPGACFFAPRHKPHTFRNDTDQPLRALVLTSPAGFERFFLACCQPAPEDENAPVPAPTPEELQKLLTEMANFGMTAHL